MYIRHQGRLPNVLCAIDLCLVAMGLDHYISKDREDSSETYVTLNN